MIVKNDNGFENGKGNGTTYSLTGLAAGNYSVCFTIEERPTTSSASRWSFLNRELSVFRSGVAGNHATYSVSGGTRTR